MVKGFPLVYKLKILHKWTIKVSFYLTANFSDVPRYLGSLIVVFGYAPALYTIAGTPTPKPKCAAQQYGLWSSYTFTLQQTITIKTFQSKRQPEANIN